MRVLVFALLLVEVAAFSSLLPCRTTYAHASLTVRRGSATGPFRLGTARSAETSQQSSSSSPTSSSQHREKVYSKERRLERNEGVDLDSLTFFETVMFSMFRGMSVPFPALRRVMLYPSRKNKILAIGLSMREGLVALSVYLSVGVLAYHRLVEQWSIVDALYFTCVCFSTVGFGDLCPTNPGSQMFTTLFGLAVLPFWVPLLRQLGVPSYKPNEMPWRRHENEAGTVCSNSFNMKKLKVFVINQKKNKRINYKTKELNKSPTRSPVFPPDLLGGGGLEES